MWAWKSTSSVGVACYFYKRTRIILWLSSAWGDYLSEPDTSYIYSSSCSTQSCNRRSHWDLFDICHRETILMIWYLHAHLLQHPKCICSTLSKILFNMNIIRKWKLFLLTSSEDIPGGLYRYISGFMFRFISSFLYHSKSLLDNIPVVIGNWFRYYLGLFYSVVTAACLDFIGDVINSMSGSSWFSISIWFSYEFFRIVVSYYFFLSSDNLLLFFADLSGYYCYGLDYGDL